MLLKLKRSDQLCSGLLIVDENKTCIIASTCYPLLCIVWIIFHEVIHLFIYKLIYNNIIRLKVDDKWDSVSEYVSPILAELLKS